MMKKCLMPWLMNLMSLPISVNYINVKWRVRNSRNLNYLIKSCARHKHQGKLS